MMQVLIVDDDPEVRRTLKAFLERNGWEVRVADEFESGIELLDDDVDVLLTDVKMGKKSGLDLLKRAKKNYPFVEVIIMTGYANLDDSIQALNLRAYAYLNKPFDFGELNKTLIKAANTRIFNQREAFYKKTLEQRVLEKTAQASFEKEKWQAIFDATPSLLLTVDKAMNIVDFNRMFENYTGTAADEVRGQLLCHYICGEKQGCICPDDQARRHDCPVFQMIDQALRSGEQVIRDQLSLTVQTGDNRERKIIRAGACLLPDSKENAPIVLMMMDDITREKEMETQLIHSGRMSALGEMASGVAHELNQPLNGIAAYIQLLQSRIEAGKTTPEEELMSIYNDLLHEVGRMSDIIGNLRIFHHSGTLAGTVDTVEIRPAYESAVKLVRAQLGKQGIELRENFGDSLPTIYTDNSRLEQLFINLVLNARDALAETDGGPKTIEVSFEPQERQGRPGVRISVSDNGPGISEDIREKIFDPFFTTKGPDKGTGLGLAICYQFVTDMGGALEVENVPEGGAIFNIWLPADRRVAQQVASIQSNGKDSQYADSGS